MMNVYERLPVCIVNVCWSGKGLYMSSPTGEKHTLILAQDFIWTRISVTLTSYVHNPINKPLERKTLLWSFEGWKHQFTINYICMEKWTRTLFIFSILKMKMNARRVWNNVSVNNWIFGWTNPLHELGIPVSIRHSLSDLKQAWSWWMSERLERVWIALTSAPSQLFHS